MCIVLWKNRNILWPRLSGKSVLPTRALQNNIKNIYLKSNSKHYSLYKYFLIFILIKKKKTVK